MSVRIALVEDDAGLRRRFVERVQFFDAVHLVLEAESGEDFFAQLAKLDEDERPAVVLMDIRMPGMSGIEATRRLTDEHPDTDVMMLTVFEDEENIFRSIQAGASGYLLKEISASDLVDAVLELNAGGAPMSPNIARRMLAYVRMSQSAGEADSLARKQTAEGFSLSRREIETLELLVEGETDLQIADRLFISPHTVRSHVKSIYRKLHVHSRAAAVRVTLENRLLDG